MNNQQKDKIKGIFAKVAKNYDFFNHLLSFGIDLYWRWQAVRIAKLPFKAKILDVGAGTCDISIAFCRHLGKDIRIEATDISTQMLSKGKCKVKKERLDKQISLLAADAEDLPYGEDNFDAVAIAFGIRNVVDRKKALKEFLKVTKPGGYLICLEFSHLSLSIFDNVYHIYLAKILPLIALLFRADYYAYKYLGQSIKEFPDQIDFSSLISSCGWSEVRYKSLTFGIVAIHYAIKPAITT